MDKFILITQQQYREYLHLKAVDEDTLIEMDDKNFRQWCSFIKRLGRRIQDNNNMLTMDIFLEIISDYPQVARWFYEPEKRSIMGYKI